MINLTTHPFYTLSRDDIGMSFKLLLIYSAAHTSWIYLSMGMYNNVYSPTGPSIDLWPQTASLLGVFKYENDFFYLYLRITIQLFQVKG